MVTHYRVITTSKKSSARTGQLRTAHGTVTTPAFMPIATRGAVKTLSAEDMQYVQSDILLSNTYHLWQRPGLRVIKKFGGLHDFMQWPGPILTDSGGYQVFSLSQRRTITERGVKFVSEMDGQTLFLTPEKAIDIQHTLGSDIIMVLDECPPYPTTASYAETSMELTTRWAARAITQYKKKKIRNQLLFGIVQGATFPELRQRHAQELRQLPFHGYAVGGLAVGEPEETMYSMLDATVPYLPTEKPRYLMGAGKPEQIIEAVRRGIDMFDCVIPTRNARHGLLYVWRTTSLKGKFYDVVHIKRAQYQNDTTPIDRLSSVTTSKKYSRAYLRHLFMMGDPLALRLASLQNVGFYLELMRRLRVGIKGGTL
ncbi:MAG: tRNA guanosine(34) transglycosylase Tgt [Candidatus Kerfeldbacteria bacterium]|nr:tRNA guanosine(34) transglycosylase Tgt [Candidatus Kerfeldbacteria bacterium]